MTLPLPGETVSRSDHAFLRLATPADLFDAVFLALSGVHVAFEPVPGFLTGFGKARKIVTGDELATLGVKVERTPQSIAAAILALLTNKSLDGHTVHLDVTDPDLMTVMVGICQCVSQRAGRPFDRADITDIMGWIAGLTDARIDAQVPYGSDEWGAFLRQEPARPDLGWYPPPPSPNFSRTIVCHVQPSTDDLARILAHAPVGMINAMAMRKKAPFAHGMSPDKRLFLPSHALAPVIAWTPHDGGAEMPVMTRTDLLSHGTPEAAYQALYGASWDRARALSREGYLATCEPVPAPLQPIWQHQREGQRPYAVDVVAMPPCDPEDLRRHVLYGGYKAADALMLPRPNVATATRVMTMTDPVETLTAQAHWSDKLADHIAGATVILSDDEAAQVVEYLSGHWLEFVGAEFEAQNLKTIS